MVVPTAEGPCQKRRQKREKHTHTDLVCLPGPNPKSLEQAVRKKPFGKGRKARELIGGKRAQ